MASIQYKAIAGRRARSCTYHCTRARWSKRSTTGSRASPLTPANLSRQAQPLECCLNERMDPAFSPNPAFWVPATTYQLRSRKQWDGLLCTGALQHRPIARTTLATILPWCGVSYTIPILRSGNQELSALHAACRQSALSSLGFDYVSRHKLQCTSMSLTSVEQLPVIAPETTTAASRTMITRDLIRNHVLRLTYTAHDMVAVRTLPEILRPAVQVG